MKTPDGKEFEPGMSGSPLAAAGAAAAAGARAVWGGVLWVLRLIGKVIATIWRLAGALDSALWRGAKLAARQGWRGLKFVAELMGAAFADFFRWLPSRAGRAYSALFAFGLILMSLWIVDELRARPVTVDGAAPRARAPVDNEDPILARIEGRYVHLSEIDASARASGALRDGEVLTVEAAFRRELVQAYVEQKLLARAAIDEGLQRDTPVNRRLGAARDRILAAALLEQRIAEVATDDAVENLYRRQADVTRLGDSVRARQIVVATEEEALSVLAALAAGGSFEELARNLSIDRSTASLGGDMDWFTKDMMTPALATAAFSTPPGERAPLFQTEFGWHILEVLDRRATSGVPLDAVRDDIRRFLRERTIAATLSELREANDVVYYSPEPLEEENSGD